MKTHLGVVGKDESVIAERGNIMLVAGVFIVLPDSIGFMVWAL